MSKLYTPFVSRQNESLRAFQAYSIYLCVLVCVRVCLSVFCTGIIVSALYNEFSVNTDGQCQLDFLEREKICCNDVSFG